MSSLLCISLLVVSLASSGYATPLSTHPYDILRERSAIAIAPLMVAEHPHGTVNNSYIVMLKGDIAPALMQNHMNFLQGVHEGYAGKFSEDTVHQIRRMPEVEGGDTEGCSLGSGKGDGVDVYVIDTGININHTEFEGRASWGKTIPQNDVDEDGNGHGTHCAGTIASRKYGVAKAAHVIAVKVLGSNGSGTMSDVVGGVVWAAQQASAKAALAKKEFLETGKTKHKGSVANMSLGGGKSKALDDTVNKAVDAGMHFAVAAGNDNRDACNNSPAAAEKAVTVGASTLGDDRAYFSNHGPCVDVFAPGLNILSTYIGSQTATTTMSGTSMASPHTAGMLAYLLSLYPSSTFNPSVTPDLVPPAMQLQPFTAPSLARMYSLAHESLPSWASTFLPSPQLVEEVIAPVPDGPKTLTPKQLKVALLALATEDALEPLPTGTPNLLIFNNATA
ncbi:hypothetical protein A0H81_10084 [Grifola frondosa]|uniref:Peptidase S8/S53 domain-containing protein n=1 Tax=Grifola frondosa TaxID=5627 RepID=A0A1C7M061_GRIFR|nr:hypothetical protein A0H81_10084 [Grifola frondosa]